MILGDIPKWVGRQIKEDFDGAGILDLDKKM